MRSKESKQRSQQSCQSIVIWIPSPDSIPGPSSRQQARFEFKLDFYMFELLPMYDFLRGKRIPNVHLLSFFVMLL